MSSDIAYNTESPTMQAITLSLTARTLYAELLELALGIGVAEPVRGLRALPTP